MCALQKGRKVGSIDRGRYSHFFYLFFCNLCWREENTRYVDGVKPVSFGALSFWHESTKKTHTGIRKETNEKSGQLSGFQENVCCYISPITYQRTTCWYACASVSPSNTVLLVKILCFPIGAEEEDDAPFN